MNSPARWSAAAITLGVVGAQGVLHWRTRLALTLAHVDLGQLRTDNTRLRTENMRLQHRRDPATGALLRDAWLAAARATMPDMNRAALLFCDVNGLKTINDRYGHRAGDTLLRQVADQLRAGFGPGALIGRFGGDEFVILVDLPEQWRAWLTAAVAACTVDIDGIVCGAAFGFTRPIDLARRDNATWLPAPSAVQLAGTQLDRLLHAADLALLRAKTRCHAEGLLTAIDFYGPKDKAVPAHLDPDPRDRIRDDAAVDAGDLTAPAAAIPLQPSRSDRPDELGTQQVLERLVAMAETLGVEPLDLDDIVHDLASKPASEINNCGLSGQIEYLLDQIGEAETEETIRDAAPPADTVHDN